MTRDRLATVVPRSFPVEVRSSVEVHKVLRLPRHLHIGGSQSAAPATKYAHGVHNALHLPRNLRMEVHKVLRLPRKLELELLKLELTGARALETRATWS